MKTQYPFTLSCWATVQLQELHVLPTTFHAQKRVCAAQTCTHKHTRAHTYAHIFTPMCMLTVEPLYRFPPPETHDSGPHGLKSWCPWIHPSPTLTLLKVFTSSSHASCIPPFLFFDFSSVVHSEDLHSIVYTFAKSHSMLFPVVLSQAEGPCSK